jgi:hypothetical protein
MGMFGPADTLAARRVARAAGLRVTENPWGEPAALLHLDRRNDPEWWTKVRDYNPHVAARMDLVEGIRAFWRGEHLDALILVERAYPAFSPYGDHARAVACAQYAEAAADQLGEDEMAMWWVFKLSDRASRIANTWSGLWGLAHARTVGRMYEGGACAALASDFDGALAGLEGTASPIELAVLRLVGELTVADGEAFGHHEEMVGCVGSVLSALERRRFAVTADGPLAAPAVGWLPLERRLRRTGRGAPGGVCDTSSAAVDIVAATAVWLRWWAGRAATTAPPPECLEWIDEGAVWGVAVSPGDPVTSRFYDPMPLEDYLDGAGEALASWRAATSQGAGVTEVPVDVLAAAVAVARTEGSFDAEVLFHE